LARADYLYLYVRKRGGKPWTLDDHLVLAFDSVQNAGAYAADIVPGVEFAQPIDFMFQCVQHTVL